MKCSADEEGNFGNILVTKKIIIDDIKHNISHTNFPTMAQIWFIKL